MSGVPKEQPPSEGSTSPSSSSLSDATLDDKLVVADKESDLYLYDVSSVAPLAPAADSQTTTPGYFILCWLGLRKRENVPALDAIATQESVYDGPHAKHYLPHEEWENKAAFDPSFRWTYREQRSAVRKTDLKILLWTMLMWFMVNVVRGNLQNATADNFLADNRMTQADYNLGLTLQRVGFLLAELPSQVIGKKLGVDVWIPIQLTCMSILGMAQFWTNGAASYITLRFLISLFQGGFVPDAILYLSYFYTKSELPVRLSCFWAMNSLANIFTGLTSSGLIEMRGVAGRSGWQWLFLIHGLLSLLVSIASFFVLAPSPSQTKKRWRKHAYYTDKDVKVIVNRIIRDDPTKATMHNRQALSLGLLWKSIKDWHLWPLYLVGLTFGLPGYPLSNYFQISMRRLGFNRINTNLLSVPYNVFTIINLLLITIASELFDSRAILASSESFWFAPFYIALYAMSTISSWEYFILATGALSYVYVHAIQAGWCSRNSGSVRTRTTSAALYNIAVQLSGIIGANLYQASDAPRYFKANGALIGVICFNIAILYPSVYWFYKSTNARRDKKWNAMTEKEQAHYLETTTDEGCKRLDFRFAY